MTSRQRAAAVLAAALAFAASPFVFGAFGGFDPGRFPIPQVDPPVQPAGWAFSIWGLIYLWLIAHGVAGVWWQADDPAWDRTRLPLLLAMAVGFIWIPVAQISPVAATALITVMLGGALLALFRAPHAGRVRAAVPLGLFAGWLTAATGVSLGLLLAGWGLAGPVTAAVGVLVWTLAIAAAMLGLRPEPAYALAVAWALLGIVAANGLAEPPVSIVAGIGAILLPALALWQRRRMRPRGHGS